MIIIAASEHQEEGDRKNNEITTIYIRGQV